MMGIGEHAKSALWTGTGFLIFIICLSSGVLLFQNSSDINDKTYELTTYSDKNQSSTLKIENKYTCSGAEVLQSIYQIKEIDVNIQVDGVIFDKNIDPDEMDVSNIDVERTYTPTYVRDSQGNLILLKYS